MLDMLGLVRRDGEEEEDDSESLLIPADQQQQLLSKSIDTTHEIDSTKNVQPPTSTAAQDAIDDFNTQLSLDDLAAPQSVAPQQEPEPDRTPQLSDEYQSLATPRVSYNTPQYDNSEFDMAPNNWYSMQRRLPDAKPETTVQSSTESKWNPGTWV